MVGSKGYREWAPDQPFLLPPSPRDWLPEGHLAYFILEVVETIDISDIENAIQSKDHRGTQPYNPRMMVALLLYAYSSGVCSSRKIERRTHEDIAFRFLSGEQHPDFSTICTFRRVHLDALASMFLHILKLCREAGLVKLGHVSLDGTKEKANASKHKAMSYDRMKEDEVRLAAEIAELLQRAEGADVADDARLGRDGKEEDLPAELKRRETRLAKIREAKAALEEQARTARVEKLREQAVSHQAAAAAATDPAEQKRAATLAERREATARALEAGVATDGPEDDPDPEPGTRATREPEAMPMHQTPCTPSGAPKPGAQRNFTDPDSRIMESHGEFVQGYNGQIAVDDAHQIIVAHGLSNQAPDTYYLVPMLTLVERNCGAPPKAITADAGYWAPANAAWCEQHGIDAYIATQRQRHGVAPVTASAEPTTAGAPQPPVAPPPTTPIEKMRNKVASPGGRQIYSRRKVLPEPVFGQIKEARGFRRFSLRGLVKVRSEWALVCACHNLLKLHRATATAKEAAKEAMKKAA
jgi:transposase